MIKTMLNLSVVADEDKLHEVVQFTVLDNDDTKSSGFDKDYIQDYYCIDTRTVNKMVVGKQYIIETNYMSRKKAVHEVDNITEHEVISIIENCLLGNASYSTGKELHIDRW